jgi:hypothetical protein
MDRLPPLVGRRIADPPMKLGRLLRSIASLMLASTLIACSQQASPDDSSAHAAASAQPALVQDQPAADVRRASVAADGMLAAKGLAASRGKLGTKNDSQNGAMSLPDSSGFEELQWDGLMPEEDYALLQKAPPVIHIGNQRSKQFGTLHTVAALNGQKVKLVGYVVPLETDSAGRMKEFFFVPFYGACIHVPPPPPNMLIHVVLAQAIDMPSMWDPFWLKGTLRIETTQSSMASSAYSMQSARLEPYSDAQEKALRKAFE